MYTLPRMRLSEIGVCYDMGCLEKVVALHIVDM